MLVGVPPEPDFGPWSAGPAPGLAGGEVGFALRRYDEENSSYSGSVPGCAVGGRSAGVLRTDPEPRWIAALGVTLESIELPGSDGTVEDGTLLVALSVVTAELLDPQFVHGAVTDAGLV